MNFNCKLIFRFVNIDINGILQLEEKVFLRKITKNEVLQKYPIDNQLTRISSIEKPHWSNHAVEAVFELEIPESELKSFNSIEKEDEFENNIKIPILLSRVLKDYPYATHLRFERPNLISCGSLTFHGYTFEPKLLTEKDQKEIIQCYKIYKQSKEDNILSKAIDRFVIAMKGNLHHPNKVNQPSWDIIVDYTISLETLLLTVANSSLDSELSYRFRLNGTSLLSIVIDTEKVKIFKILGLIYGIRSKTVHGANDLTILKDVNKIINELGIEDEHHKHGIGRLILLRNLLEDWTMKIFKYLVQIEYAQRPYVKEGGWEALLWEKK